MSYSGTYGADETCRHGAYYLNCTKCIVEAQEARGVRDERGINHADNGAGWCVGHIEGPGDGRCTVLVRHCPVLNTPEQLAQHRREDRLLAVAAAEQKVIDAREAVWVARRELAELENS